MKNVYELIGKIKQNLSGNSFFSDIVAKSRTVFISIS